MRAELKAASLAIVVVLLMMTPTADLQVPAETATIRIGVARGTGYEVVSIPLDTYVSRVLAGEALPGSAPAALDALAIAVRTYTAANLGRHRAEGFDLCDQTHCQVMRTANAATERAALATSGQVLLYRGAPASVYYSASCGGRTEIPSAVWPGAEDPPYLPSRSDADGCGGDPAWTSELALSDLRRSFAEAGFRGTLRSMRVASRDASGRVAFLALEGLTPSAISGQDLRMAVGRTLGWQHVRSAAFELRRIGDVYRLDGHGSGHGVGMCVIGSAKLAASGRSAPAILDRYFPGLTIGSFTPSLTQAPLPLRSSPAGATAPGTVPNSGVAGIVVVLPDGSIGDDAERDRGTLLTIVARARDALAATLHVPAPARLTVRVHRTSDEYDRATGRQWFTSGAVVNGEMHLLPLSSLRDRGLLERTVWRQVVHVLIDTTLGRRPAWVREGAALFFGDEEEAPQTTTGGRPSCPSDAELLRPVSPGALSTAYAEARACFARQMAGGRSWRDVR